MTSWHNYVEDAVQLQNAVEAAFISLIENSDLLNELDSVCGDGDCGTTLKFGSEGQKNSCNFYNNFPRSFLFMSCMK